MVLLITENSSVGLKYELEVQALQGQRQRGHQGQITNNVIYNTTVLGSYSKKNSSSQKYFKPESHRIQFESQKDYLSAIKRIKKKY